MQDSEKGQGVLGRGGIQEVSEPPETRCQRSSQSGQLSTPEHLHSPGDVHSSLPPVIGEDSKMGRGTLVSDPGFADHYLHTDPVS